MSHSLAEGVTDAAVMRAGVLGTATCVITGGTAACWTRPRTDTRRPVNTCVWADAVSDGTDTRVKDDGGHARDEKPRAPDVFCDMQQAWCWMTAGIHTYEV